MGRTHEALQRAEKEFQKLTSQKKRSANIEPQLITLGLSEAQILDQNPHQLKQSLAKLNTLIQNQLTKHDKKTDSNEESKRIILHNLLTRKELVLGYLDMLLTKNKKDEIRNLAKNISDEKLKSDLIANLNDLEKLNHFLTKEYIKVIQTKKML